jgi:hypothetical protein
MTTIAEALRTFEETWVESQPITPSTAYRRTLRLIGMFLGDQGVALDQSLEALQPERLREFIRWHQEHALADDPAGTRKVAVHVARLGGFLAEHYGRDDLAVDRDALRALVVD